MTIEQQPEREPDNPERPNAMELELVPIEKLQPYPGNYRKHPPEQLAHLVASLQQYGWARNVVVSSDGVILAGHGIVEAARQTGLHEVPVHRLEYASDDPRAAKFLVLDNEVSRLAEDDNDQLAALLSDIQQTDDLGGTGYSDEELDRLIEQIEGLSDAQPQDVGASAQAWMIVIDCTDEQQQIELLERFESEGLKCRALIG
jgi:ParB-like chromosome segregation protein Spo0J